MKNHALIPLIGLGLACLGGPALGSDHSVSIDTVPISADSGFQVIFFVGHTPGQYAKALRMANNWEGRRHLNVVPMSVVARAYDASSLAYAKALASFPTDQVAVVDVP